MNGKGGARESASFSLFVFLCNYFFVEAKGNNYLCKTNRKNQ